MTRVSKFELRVAACQMTSNDDVKSNASQIFEFLKNFEAQDDNVDLVSFPENSLFFRINTGGEFNGIAKDDPFFKELAAWARQYKTNIHLGSVALKNPNTKLLNGTVWVNSEGEICFPYSKIHLFDVDVPGEAGVRESDVFTAGTETAVVQIDQWNIGLSICYDLRFSELYLRYAKAEVDLILVPSAFLVTTGRAHWHNLLKARAIEAQAYVVAAAQGGRHLSSSGEKRYTYGHSMIIEPWGEIVKEVLDDGQKYIVHTLKKSVIEKVRAQIPMRNHRRLS